MDAFRGGVGGGTGFLVKNDCSVSTNELHIPLLWLGGIRLSAATASCATASCASAAVVVVVIIVIVIVVVIVVIVIVIVVIVVIVVIIVVTIAIISYYIPFMQYSIVIIPVRIPTPAPRWSRKSTYKSSSFLVKIRICLSCPITTSTSATTSTSRGGHLLSPAKIDELLPFSGIFISPIRTWNTRKEQSGRRLYAPVLPLQRYSICPIQSL